MRRPRFGWYGDDFTGATDTLAALAQGGLSSMLFLRVPTAEQLASVGPLDAIGIAGAARSMSPEDMKAELEPVGRFFAETNVPVLLYKCCSTFDSAPHIGSIGAAVGVLKPFFPNPFLPIVGGQPSIGRYCLFSNLFAAAGTGREVARIDRHRTMMRHPVTPMGEADLRLHLAKQGMERIGAVHFPAYSQGGLDNLIDAELASNTDSILFDVAEAAHLPLIGEAIWQRAEQSPLLAIGASSVAQALVAHWGEDGNPLPKLAPAKGPVFVLAGSLSPVTRRQVEHARSYEAVAGDAVRLIGDEAYRNGLLDDFAARLAAGRNVLFYTAPETAGAADTSLSAETAKATARLLAALLERQPLRRVGVAGGDTSSHAVKELGAWGLSYRTAIAPGVTVSIVHSDNPALSGMEIMLKGGQMGPDDIFERLLG